MSRTILNLKEIKNRIIELLSDIHSNYYCIDLLSLNTDEFRRKLIAILTDIHGGWEIPREEQEAIADMLLPGIIKFFSTEESRAEFEAWKREQEALKKTATDCNLHHYGKEQP